MIATVTPGLSGDTLTLTETAGSGTLSLGPENAQTGAYAVIYTAPALVSSSTIDAVTNTISDQHDDAMASDSENVQLNAGPTFSISAPGTATVGVGQTSPVNGISLTLEDTSASSDTFAVTLSDGSGELSASATGVSPSGTSLIITGTVDDVNAALGTLTDNDASTPSDTLAISATDETSGENASPASVAITVNGQPMIEAPGSVTAQEGGPPRSTAPASRRQATRRHSPSC